ncbi:hypothetical protein [Terrihabitans sp. B22-R8]|uniref:hypothetical protein n=1 Tax=Terrihabitans sp. B22-R8 TaxID=3425128 RepID=UPI00403D1356
MTQSDPAELARAFIADQENAGGSKPSFWTMNHHRLAPIAGKLPGALEPAERTAFYAFYMQRSGGFPPVPEKEIPLLVDAYRRLLPGIDQSRPNHMETRFDSLYVFGFDDAGELPGGALDSAKDLKVRLKTLVQVGKYTTLPAQRDKKDKFRPFIGEAPRLLQMLRHLDYVHDRRRSGEAFDLVNLRLWGMILIILLNPETRTELLRGLVEGAPDLPRRDEYLALLYTMVRAMADEAGGEETRFHELVGKLAAIEKARRDKTESAALVRALDLDLADEFDWTISISVAEQGSERSPHLAPHLRLSVRSEPDFEWEVEFTHSTLGRYSESPKKVYRNDAGVKPLHRLDAFPSWLRDIAEASGAVFDVDNIAVLAGRKRSVAKRVIEWVREGT